MRTEIVREYLGSRVDGSVWRGVTLRFARSAGSSWPEYFGQVDRATAAVIELIDRPAPE
ncbi:hypothetical protein AB0O22_16875 [Streptomyces sp. NPDC091204]|uniref:hypothetical protein n=1 Tax=Streptomyces sp. NPDC091204 TaxID=3155299 RepID=UPI00342CFFB7